MSQPIPTDLDVVEAQKSNVAKSATETLLRVLGGTHIRAAHCQNRTR
jgi:hypothetical protein